MVRNKKYIDAYMNRFKGRICKNCNSSFKIENKNEWRLISKNKNYPSASLYEKFGLNVQDYTRVIEQDFEPEHIFSYCFDNIQERTIIIDEEEEEEDIPAERRLFLKKVQQEKEKRIKLLFTENKKIKEIYLNINYYACSVCQWFFGIHVLTNYAPVSVDLIVYKGNKYKLKTKAEILLGGKLVDIDYNLIQSLMKENLQFQKLAEGCFCICKNCLRAEEEEEEEKVATETELHLIECI
jgi:hypothetical protein